MFVLLQIQCINDRTNELKKKKKSIYGENVLCIRCYMLI